MSWNVVLDLPHDFGTDWKLNILKWNCVVHLCLELLTHMPSFCVLSNLITVFNYSSDTFLRTQQYTMQLKRLKYLGVLGSTAGST